MRWKTVTWKTVVVVALLAALPVTGFADEGPATGPALGSGAATLEAVPLQSDLAKLIPANADILVYAPSARQLIAKANEFLKVFGEEVAGSVDLVEMLGQITGPVQPYFDATSPLAVAFAVPAEGDPVPALILPVTDVAGVVATFAKNGQEPPRTQGAYVLVPMGPPAAASSDLSALAHAIPTGDLVVRVNLAALMEKFGDGVRAGFDEGLGMAEENGVPGMPDMGKIFDGMKETVSDLLESVEHLDLSVALDGASIHFDGLLSMKDGSKMATTESATADLGAMAAMLPGDFPVVGLFSFDMQGIMSWIEPFMDIAIQAVPEAQRADYEKQIRAAMKLYDYIGNRAAMGYRMDGEGIVAAVVMDLTDADKYMEGWRALLDGDYLETMAKMGMKMTRLPATKVAGFDVERFAMMFDVDKMAEWNPGMQAGGPEAADLSQKMLERIFGADGLRVSMAVVDGRLVSVMGGDDALLTQAIQCAAGLAGPQTDDLAAAVNVAGGRPSFLFRMDLREVIQGALVLMKDVLPPEMSEDMPEIEDGEPMDLLLYGTHDGRFYEGGVKINLAGLADLIETFQNAMR